MIIRIFLLLISLNSLIFFKVNAQLTETYFSDIETKEGGKVNDFIKVNDCIIIGGQSFENYPDQPSITKIDTLGNVIWSTTSFDTTVYSSSNVYIHRLMLSGAYLYASCIISQWPNHPKEIWKVDATNGNIIWKKSFYSYNYMLPEHIVDFDTNKFIVGYTDDYNGFVYKKRFAFIDKITGDTLSTHPLGNFSWQRSQYGLAIDSQKNIYYTKHDSIFKVDPSNVDSIIWGVRHISADVLDFQRIYIDQNDSIFLFGTKDAIFEVGKVLSIGKSYGSMNWHVSALTGEDVAYRDLVDKNGHIYVTWRQTTHGGGNYEFWTTKIEKVSGNVEWNSSYSFIGVGTPDTHSGNGEGAISLDVDDSGSVFLTGYYGDANAGPENWGILKLDGNTGTCIYELTITEDSVKYDNISIGMASCVINNKPYFVGVLQTFHGNYERGKTTLIKLDGDSGNILEKKFVGSKYQFPSKTIQIENYGTDKTVVFKQVGRFSNVSLYDFNKNILWEKTFLKNYMLFASNLIINENGTTIFSAYSVDQINSYPYYSNQTDSIHIFFIDSLGNLMTEYSFYVGVNEATPVELISDGNSTFIFYQKSNTVYFRKIDGSGISSEYNLNVTYYEQLSQTKYAINHNSSTLLIFGYKNFVNKVIELNKNSLNVTDLANIPLIQKINYAAKFSNNNIILCGQDNTGKDVLINYNTALLSTSWTKSYTPQSEMLKFTFDVDSTYIYSIGKKSSDVVLRKIKTQDGVQSWSYSYNGPSNLMDEPIDIAYDKYRSQLITTGYQTDGLGPNANKNVFIEVIDTSSAYFNTYIKQGDFDGDNLGLCCEVLKNGSIWVGGNLNTSLHGKAGYIFEIDSSLYCQSFLTVTACDSFISPSTNYTWKSPGTYIDTILNASGCDNVVIINLTIGSNSGTDIQTGCNSYFWPLNNTTYTSSTNTPTTTLTNTAGCDSVVTLNLTININSTSSISPTACDGYTSPSTNYTWTSSGTYMDTVPNAVGCDSMITVNLTINNSNSITVSQTACDSYTWPLNNTTYTNSTNTPTVTLSNATGCDSVIKLNLTINNSYSGTDNQTACDSYTWPLDSTTYTNSTNTPTVILTNALGCDSVVRLNLTINTVDSSVSNTSSLLTANAQGAAYQWLDCNNNFSIIGGATNQSFIATANGSYAVEVTLNGCTDTSSCYTIIGLIILENNFGTKFNAFPNPTYGQLTLDLGQVFENVTITQSTLTGQVLHKLIFISTNQAKVDIIGAPGIYILDLMTGEGRTAKLKVVKN